jgi:hypothetical protein
MYQTAATTHLNPELRQLLAAAKKSRFGRSLQCGARGVWYSQADFPLPLATWTPSAPMATSPVSSLAAIGTPAGEAGECSRALHARARSAEREERWRAASAVGSGRGCVRGRITALSTLHRKANLNSHLQAPLPGALPQRPKPPNSYTTHRVRAGLNSCTVRQIACQHRRGCTDAKWCASGSANVPRTR